MTDGLPTANRQSVGWLLGIEWVGSNDAEVVVMTRKDYVRFAEMLAGEWACARCEMPDDTVVRPKYAQAATLTSIWKLTLSTADIFKQDNPKFDRARFYAAVFGDDYDGDTVRTPSGFFGAA